MYHSDLPIALQRIGYREKGTTYHYAPHRREIHQWYCVLYGTVDMLVGDEHYELRSCFTIPGEPQARAKTGWARRPKES